MHLTFGWKLNFIAIDFLIYTIYMCLLLLHFCSTFVKAFSCTLPIFLSLGRSDRHPPQIQSSPLSQMSLPMSRGAQCDDIWVVEIRWGNRFQISVPCGGVNLAWLGNSQRIEKQRNVLHLVRKWDTVWENWLSMHQLMKSRDKWAESGRRGM